MPGAAGAEAGPGVERDASALEKHRGGIVGQRQRAAVEPGQVGALRLTVAAPTGRCSASSSASSVPVGIQPAEQAVEPVAAVAQGGDVGDDAERGSGRGGPPRASARDRPPRRSPATASAALSPARFQALEAESSANARSVPGSDEVGDVRGLGGRRSGRGSRRRRRARRGARPARRRLRAPRSCARCRSGCAGCTAGTPRAVRRALAREKPGSSAAEIDPVLGGQRRLDHAPIHVLDEAVERRVDRRVDDDRVTALPVSSLRTSTIPVHHVRHVRARAEVELPAPPADGELGERLGVGRAVRVAGVADGQRLGERLGRSARRERGRPSRPPRAAARQADSVATSCWCAGAARRATARPGDWSSTRTLPRRILTVPARPAGDRSVPRPAARPRARGGPAGELLDSLPSARPDDELELAAARGSARAGVASSPPAPGRPPSATVTGRCGCTAEAAP